MVDPVSQSNAVLIETNDKTDAKEKSHEERWVKIRYFKEVTSSSPMNDAACQTIGSEDRKHVLLQSENDASRNAAEIGGDTAAS